jgi:hypothetical protein
MKTSNYSIVTDDDSGRVWQHAGHWLKPIGRVRARSYRQHQINGEINLLGVTKSGLKKIASLRKTHKNLYVYVGHIILVLTGESAD